MTTPILWKATPNFTPGRSGQIIDRIIIHSTEGNYANSVGWLCNKVSDASAHYVIREDGLEITQLVKDSDTAWHAGNWDYNLRSIGIEHSWYSNGAYGLPSEGLYRAGAELTASLCKRYNIPADRKHIIPHREVPAPNNHTDCDGGGKWDWNKFMGYVKQFMDASKPGKPAVAPAPVVGGWGTDDNPGYFPQTGKTIADILPDGTTIGFFEYWQEHGALEVFGYPLTGAYFNESMGLVVQWFERARFEFHPDADDTHKIQLGLLGAEALEAGAN